MRKKNDLGGLEKIYRLILFVIHGPYWLKIICCYFIILLSAIPFYFGYQIYPVNNVYNTQDMNPECLSIDQIGYIQDRNFFNLSYSLNTQDPMTRSISFGLFRIIVNGKFYKEELRKFDIDQIIQYQNGLFSVSYELFQEGPTNFTIKCLDRDLFDKTLEINEIQNSLKFTIFHKDDSISNVCFSGDEKVIFVRNNVKYFSPYINNHLTFINSSVEPFLLNNRDFQISPYPVIDIYQKTTFELLSEVLPFTFFISQNGQISNFMVNTISDESKDLIEFIQSIVKEPVIKSNISFINYCYVNDVRLYNYSILSKLHENTIKNNSKKNIEKNHIINSIYGSFKQISLRKYGNSNKDDANEKPKIVFAHPDNINITNLNELKEFFDSNENFKIVNISELTLQQKILEFSNTQIMISFDDNNEVSNAMWMPDDSTLIVLHDERARLSSAVNFVKSLNIDVLSINIKFNQKVEVPISSIEKILKDL